MSAEDWKYFLELLSVFLTAATKFLFSPLAGYYLELGFKTTFIVTTLGGLTGIISFAFLGTIIRKYWRRLICIFIVPFSQATYKELIAKPANRFTRMNRFIVVIRRKFGLVGLAFLTPVIISIPVGTIIGMNIYSKKGRVLVAMIISLLLWSVVLNIATPWVMEYIAKTAAGI